MNMDARELISWTFDQKKPTIVTTSFGNHSAVFLHMVKEINPQAKIVWVDTQFNTTYTLKHMNKLVQSLYLNIYPYIGKPWIGEIPVFGTPEHALFVDQVKLEPMRRAIADLQPAYWITGVRAEQTDHRKTLKPVDTVNGITKVCPLLNWSDFDLDLYLMMHCLPNESRYFDPTKQLENQECGLHTSYFQVEATA